MNKVLDFSNLRKYSKLSFTIIILGAAILIYILVQNYKIKIKLQNFLDYFFNQNGIKIRRPRNKFADVSEAYLEYSKKRKSNMRKTTKRSIARRLKN
jgi:hypothetical protein